MADEDAARARAVLGALEGLSDRELELAASSVGGKLGAVLDELRRVRGRSDAPASAARALAALQQRDIDELRASLRGIAGQLSRVPEPAPPPALPDSAELGRLGRELATKLGDPELADARGRAAELLAGPLGEAASAGAAVGEVQRTLRELGRVLAADPDASIDTERLRDSLRRLRSQRDRLAGVQREMADAGAVLEAVGRIALEAGQPAAAARLAAARAELLEKLGAAPGETRQAWELAFERALHGRALPEAIRAGRRLQLRAMAGGEIEPVATVADRVAALARELGQGDAEMAARGEAALALAQVPGCRREALERCDAALEAAARSDSPVVRAQARLVQGQVLEKLGELPAARAAYRRLMTSARQDPSFPYELGWAAMHLGRLEAEQGQRGRARRNLGLAAQVGRRVGDWLLYGLAMRSRFEVALAAGDRERAMKVLDQLGSEGPALGGDQATALHRELSGRMAR